MNFTNSEIGKLEAKDRDYEVTDPKTTGLKIKVTKSGTKTFYFKWRQTGKLRKYQIGKFGDISVPTARKVAEQLKAEIALGNDPQAQKVEDRKQAALTTKLILRNYLDNEYYPFIKTNQKRPETTIRLIELRFKDFMHLALTDITPQKLDKWVSGQLSNDIKPATVNRAINAIKALLNQAVKWHLINSNPIEGFKRLKTDKKGVVRFLSEIEEERLWQAIHSRGIDDHIKPLFTVLLNTGARPQEAFNLRWDDINFTNKLLTVQASFSKTGQTRHIPINEKLLSGLTEWKLICPSNELVFPSNMNADKPIVSVNKAWYKLRRNAELIDFRLYDLRHTFASKLVMKGIDIYTVSELLGHSSIEMTKIYAHLSPDHLKSAVDKL
ncbi:site-specific integrase [Thiomicrorhabdus sp. 6S3-12]|uniref:site-specific integrase n=1 Tax=Thiomicrorhabdus sp. 6S3-12 TaxID=2819681 RepID=UPI001AAD5BB6|nr:site-specific integrase [Thiomicrorhabdus sp. 6S3-12]MBO1924586.1 tyrosine-type recombinase/integrase [Thiomicrorhabdus sp. 6S3-12]